MNKLRTLLSAVVVAFLGLGYAASQNAALSGNASQYATQVDTPTIQYFALVLLGLCIVFAFLRDREADES